MVLTTSLAKRASNIQDLPVQFIHQLETLSNFSTRKSVLQNRTCYLACIYYEFDKLFHFILYLRTLLLGTYQIFFRNFFSFHASFCLRPHLLPPLVSEQIYFQAFLQSYFPLPQEICKYLPKDLRSIDESTQHLCYYLTHMRFQAQVQKNKILAHSNRHPLHCANSN